MASECHNQQQIEEALMKMHELTNQAYIRYIRSYKAIQKNEEFKFLLERMAQIAETSETEVEE
jgi:transcriptional regulator NrdR family protein